MSGRLASVAGRALLWKGTQVGGVKVIFLARLLILARLLSPDDFGLFAIAVVAVDFLLSVTDTGMVPALVQHRRPEARHYDGAWTVGLIRATVVGGAIVLGAPLIAGLFGEPRAVPLLQVLAVRPLLDAAASMRVAGLMRNLRFRALAFLRLPEALVNTIASIALARPLGVWALVAGPLAGSAAYLVLSYVLAPYRPRLSVSGPAVVPLIRYGRWIFLAAVLAVGGGAVLYLAISRKLGAVELGIYFLAAKLAFLPAEVSGEVVGSVAFPVYSRLQADPAAGGRAFRSILRGTAAVLFPVAVLLFILAPSLVEHVLGPRWDGTVGVIRVLACVSVLGMLGDAVVPVLKGIGQPGKIAVLELIQATMLVGLVWELAGRFGVLGAALAWVAASGGSQLAAVAFVRRALGRPFRGMRGPALAVVAAGGAAGAAAWLANAALGGLAGLGVALALATAVHVTALWFLDRRFRLGLAADVARAFPQAAGLISLRSPARP